MTERRYLGKWKQMKSGGKKDPQKLSAAEMTSLTLSTVMSNIQFYVVANSNLSVCNSILLA